MRSLRKESNKEQLGTKKRNFLEMKVISIRENPEFTEQAIQYIQNAWSEVAPIIYEDCIKNCLTATQPLPQWYLLEKNGEIIGCAGLITNDFISRMDLYPWLCAIFINEDESGNNFANILVNKAIDDTKKFGFKRSSESKKAK